MAGSSPAMTSRMLIVMAELTRPLPEAEKGRDEAAPGNGMSTERKPIAFGDMRGWLSALDKAGELQTIGAEVDWNIELGTVSRLAQGPGTGKALLFNKIRDYGENARCRQVFAGALSSYRRIAMMFGLPPDTHP